jgi:hypothetical protein
MLSLLADRLISTFGNSKSLAGLYDIDTSMGPGEEEEKENDRDYRIGGKLKNRNKFGEDALAGVGSADVHEQ